MFPVALLALPLDFPGHHYLLGVRPTCMGQLRLLCWQVSVVFFIAKRSSDIRSVLGTNQNYCQHSDYKADSISLKCTKQGYRDHFIRVGG